MWLILGAAAIITAALNLICMTARKETKWFRFISLSLTALTVCAFYSSDAKFVMNQDWGALMDIVPTMSKALWVCTGLSIIINGISLFDRKK